MSHQIVQEEEKKEESCCSSQNSVGDVDCCLDDISNEYNKTEYPNKEQKH
jgi:hypothetical protein